MTKKASKWDEYAHDFLILSHATGQTWHHTSAGHLSALVKYLYVSQRVSPADLSTETDTKHTSPMKFYPSATCLFIIQRVKDLYFLISKTSFKKFTAFIL